MTTITKTALGRVAEIGDFYDAVNDVFIPCNIFKQEIPREYLTVKPLHSVKSTFHFTNTSREKMRLWDVEGDLSLSVASGMLKIFHGSATYLNEKRESSHSLHCVFSQHMEHELEKLNISYEHLENKVFVNGIATGATHVVVGVLRGCDAFVELSCDLEDNTTENVAKGQIETTFGKFDGMWKQFWDSIWKKRGQAVAGSVQNDRQSIEDTTSTSLERQPDQKKKSVDNGCRIKWKRTNSQEVSNVQLKIFADAQLEEGLTPTSLEEAQETIKKIVQSVGKGKTSTPLVYTLLDVKEIARIFNVPHTTNNIFTSMSSIEIEKCRNLLAESEENVLKISEFGNRIEEYKRFLPLERIEIVKNKKRDVEEMDKSLQQEMAELIRKMRSTVRSDELIMEFGEKLAVLTYSHLKTSNADKFMEENRDLDRFMTFVEKLLSLNVIFVNTIEEFWDMKKEETHFLVFSLEDVSKDDSQWEKTRSNFLSLCEQEGTVCAAVTTHLVPEITKLSPKENGAKIIITKDGSFLTKDLLAHFETIKKFNIVTPTGHHIPPEKNALSLVCAKLPCPNPFCSTSNNEEWYCSGCYKVLEYDQEDHFYCSCGRLPVENFLFKCNGEAHGNFEIPYPAPQLRERLKSHKPYQQVNLLFIGETGTGKTTLINSFPTYLTYSSFKEAQKEPSLKILIDFQLRRSVIREDQVENKRYIFKSNEPDVHGQVSSLEPNEAFIDGQSSTRMPRSHYFKHDETIYNIIDTPGIGDIGGPEKDKENVQNILNYVCNLEYVHLICFVIPADAPRLTERFLYCFKELIMQFHKSAIGNIAFCITKAGINFEMGNTTSCLQALFDGIKEARDIIIPLQQKNIFIFDNTGWLDMAAATQEKEDDAEKNISGPSQEFFHRSQDAVRRLMLYASSCQPHKTEDTKQIWLARSTIQRLSGHLLIIGENVHKTVRELVRRREMIEQFKGDEEELLKILKKKVKIFRGHLKGGLSILCEECERKLKEDSKFHWSLSYTRLWFLAGGILVAPQSIPLSLAFILTYGVVLTRNIDRCVHKIMNPQCCGCHLGVNGRLKFFIRKYVVEEEKEEIDVAVQQNLRGFKDREHEVELRIQADEKLLEEIEEEKSSINRALAKFAHFLKEHSIAIYNDTTEEYYNMVIAEEKKNAGRSEKFNMFTRMKDEYGEEKKLLVQLETDHQEGTISAEDVFALVEELKKLKHYGKDIEEAFKEANERNFEINGTVYDPKGQLPFMAKIGTFIKKKITFSSQ